MALGIEAFRSYAQNHINSNTNLILNATEDGLTTTKARGGVNMLAGLLNIGTRARYGRETLEALKDALISEFKTQNGLSDQECMVSVNKAFKDAFGMDFEKAKSKAIKLNPAMLTKVLNAAETEIAARMGRGFVAENAPMAMKIDHVFASSSIVRSENGISRTEYVNSKKLGPFVDNFAKSLLPKIRELLNRVVGTPADAKKLIGQLKDWGSYTEQLLNGDGAADDEHKEIVAEMKKEIDDRVAARVNELTVEFKL